MELLLRNQTSKIEEVGLEEVGLEEVGSIYGLLHQQQRLSQRLSLRNPKLSCPFPSLTLE